MTNTTHTPDPQQLTDADWQARLDPLTYRVTRQKGTEEPFSGKYWNEHTDGSYHCSNCGIKLFDSSAKFDSGTGWPSFDRPGNTEQIRLQPDESHGMHRTEVTCKSCGAHLGHLFDDGPTATGRRYCINSCALNLQKK